MKVTLEKPLKGYYPDAVYKHLKRGDHYLHASGGASIYLEDGISASPHIVLRRQLTRVEELEEQLGNAMLLMHRLNIALEFHQADDDPKLEVSKDAERMLMEYANQDDEEEFG